MNGFLKDRADGTPRPGPSGAALALSAALHTGVVLTALALADRSRPQSESADGVERPAMQLVYVAPAPERRVRPLPPQPAPPVPREEPAAAPVPRPPAVPPMPAVPEHDEPAGRPLEPPAAPEPPATAERAETATPSGGTETASSEPTIVTEARRIFGRRTRGGAPSGGPAAARGLPIHLPGRSDECVRRPAPARPPAAPVQLATVSGRVFREGTRMPLAGAHLQMIGTPHVAFSDDAGRYDLQFDPALVDECRTQYVRVTAPGFRAQTLVLYLGPSAANDIPMSRR